MCKNEKIKAILIAVCFDNRELEKSQSSLDELESLADTANIETIGKFIQKRSEPDKTFYAGKGFLTEIISENEADILIFNNELSPTQSMNIEKNFDIEISDRTELILDIFHDHAQTREAKLQVKLAELKYQLPRLKKLWSHLDREKGQASGSKGVARGMGEKQSQIDRRKIRNEISKIGRLLRKIDLQKTIQNKQRQKLKKVCLIGYTNAGKSTLFNRLTKAGVLVADKLFATLSTTTRKLIFEKGNDVILSDTVGFIANLPHQLVSSFKATLKDVENADLLLHIIDISDENYQQYMADVEDVLTQIKANEIPQIVVYNKIDKATEFPEIEDSISISAKTGSNVESLLDLIDEKLHQSYKFEFMFPHSEQKKVNQLFESGQILTKEYDEKGVIISAIVNRKDVREFERFVVN